MATIKPYNSREFEDLEEAFIFIKQYPERRHDLIVYFDTGDFFQSPFMRYAALRIWYPRIYQEYVESGELVVPATVIKVVVRWYAGKRL